MAREFSPGRSVPGRREPSEMTHEEFNALVEDLVATLDKFKVPEKEKGELLSVLGPMRKDIVTKQ